MGHLALYGPIACTSWDLAHRILTFSGGYPSESFVNAIKRSAVRWIVIGGGIATIKSISRPTSDDSFALHLSPDFPNPPPPIVNARAGVLIPATPASIYILGGN
jgi:hypothetical protein